jgi:hypothetical protein
MNHVVGTKEQSRHVLTAKELMAGSTCMIMLAFHNISQVGRDADEPVIEEALPNKAGGIGELGQTAILFRTSSSCGVRDFTALSDALASIRCQRFSRYSAESARVLRK